MAKKEHVNHIIGLSGSTISISFPTFECFQGESHTLYKDILARWWPLTQVVPLWSEFALGAARLILQYSARSRLGKRSGSTLWWWEILHEMGIEHYLNGNIIIIMHKCIIFFHCHVLITGFLLNILRPGEWNMWGDGIIDSMIDPCGALQAPASSSKRPSGNINCLLGWIFKSIFGLFQTFSIQTPELVG